MDNLPCHMEPMPEEIVVEEIPRHLNIYTSYSLMRVNRQYYKLLNKSNNDRFDKFIEYLKQIDGLKSDRTGLYYRIKKIDKKVRQELIKDSNKIGVISMPILRFNNYGCKCWENKNTFRDHRMDIKCPGRIIECVYCSGYYYYNQ